MRKDGRSGASALLRASTHACTARAVLGRAAQTPQEGAKDESYWHARRTEEREERDSDAGLCANAWSMPAPRNKSSCRLGAASSERGATHTINRSTVHWPGGTGYCADSNNKWCIDVTARLAARVSSKKDVDFSEEMSRNV